MRKTKYDPLEDYRHECRDIAVMLEQDSQEAFDRAIPRGRAAMESAFLEMKKRAVFARFFAFEAKLHRACPSRVCKRARYCKGLSLRCTRGRVLDREEETYARGRFVEFMRIMRAPETEEEQRFSAKTARRVRTDKANSLSASRNARESDPTRRISPANQIQ